MQNSFTPKAYAGSTTTTIGTGNVFVHTVIIPKTTANTVTLEQADGTDYYVFPASTVAGTYIFDSIFPSGLVVNCAGADTGVVTYSQ